VKDLSTEQSAKHVIFVVAGGELAAKTSTLMHHLLLASQQAVKLAAGSVSEQLTFWIVSQGAWSVDGNKD
jgi:hypothetical protein